MFSPAAATRRDEGTIDVGITAGQRFELHNALVKALGDDVANTLMEQLWPVETDDLRRTRFCTGDHRHSGPDRRQHRQSLNPLPTGHCYRPGFGDEWRKGEAAVNFYLDLMRAFSFGIILLVAIIAVVGGGVAFTRQKSSTKH